MTDGEVREGTAATGGDELRPVTALFADIVGSTSLGERLSPDEVKALVGECVNRMSRAVEEFGGTIQAYMGDGICALFGVPVAHEDDPERAGRAALRILEVVGEYGRDVESAWGIAGFNVRVGINSGQAAVGMIGASFQQQVALGDTTNVAARLESAAGAGQIYVGPLTAARTAKRFVFEPVGDVKVKGRDEPVRVSRLLRPTSFPPPDAVTPIVGRDADVARLEAVGHELAGGRGQVVFVVGDAGIGKTRMLAELRRTLGDRAVWLEGRSPSYGTEILYGPFVEMLRAWLGVEEGDAEVAVRTRLRAKIGALVGDAVSDVLPPLAQLLGAGVDPDSRDRLRSLSPEGLREAVRAAFSLWIEALAAERAVVVALDDLQWSDTATREVAAELIALTDRAPVAVVAAFRSDPASEAWRLRISALSEYPHRVVEIPLGPLPTADAERLVRMLAPGLLDEGAVRDVVVRAEGNPLYVEELVRAVVEAGGATRERTWTIAAPGTETLPPILEGLFVARIGRLPESPRRLAQVAAIIGRTFPVRVLEAVAETADTKEDLSALLRAEIVRETRRFPELECTFKHGLLQEAALSTLPVSRQRALYGRIGAAFEQTYAGLLDERLDLLAYYYYRSDDQRKALEYLERAAERAASLDETARAAELWARASKVASKLGDEEAVRRVAERGGG